MSERMTPERLVEIREIASVGWLSSVHASELLAELDAVTKERDEAIARIGEIEDEVNDKDAYESGLEEELAALKMELAGVVEQLEKIEKKSGSYSGMNFIANRDGRIR